jgi:phage tail sheath protein FI
MPVAPTYPGVYVEEVPSGVHPIAGVPTAIGAFIGRFPKGVMNTAVEVLSFADVEREFGGLSAQSDTSFALSQFFLNGGARAWVVRVAAPGDGGDALDAAAIDVPADGGGTAFTLTATSQGAWGRNLRAQILGPDTDHRFDLTVSVVGQSGGRPAVLQQETFRGLTCASVDDANYVTTAVNGVSQLVVVSGAGTTDPVPTGLVSGTGLTGLTAAADRQIDVKVGTASAVTVRLPATAVTTLEELAAVVQSAIRGANGADPVWAGVVVHPLPGAGSLQILTGVANDDDIVVTDTGTTTSGTDLELIAADAASTQASALASAGGGDGGPPGAPEIVGSEAAGTGMHALENTDFTLLCLPSIANQRADGLDDLPDAGEYLGIVGSAIAYCRDKRALLLLDPPLRDAATAVDTPAALRAWLGANSAIRDEFSALYYPRVTVTDPTRNNQPRSLGPCGTIAGLMARIDASRGVWKAPAGTEATLRGLTRIDVDLTDPQNGLLNPIAVNCLRTFDAYGMVSWGARTLAGSDAASSDYKYVPVRRLANFLESSLYIGLKWAVFEPNDEPLWSQIRLNVGSFMHGLFMQGAFAGRTPRDAYVVSCDATTTTAADQALGVVNVLVGFAPLRPAEFVVLRIQQLAGQIQT